LKGLLKGFWWPFRSLKLVKYSQSYSPNEVCDKKIVRWAVDNKEDWGREEEVEADYRKIKEMILQKFLKWKKVFGKVESERMPTRKIWDHAIDLKIFKPRKGRIYSLSKNKREEV